MSWLGEHGMRFIGFVGPEEAQYKVYLDPIGFAAFVLPTDPEVMYDWQRLEKEHLTDEAIKAEVKDLFEHRIFKLLAVNEPIEFTEEEARDLLKSIMMQVGPGFHVDTHPTEYVRPDMTQWFADLTCARIEEMLATFDKQFGKTLYDLAWDEYVKLFHE